MGLDLYLNIEKPIACKCCNSIAGYKVIVSEDFGSSSELYSYVVNDICAQKHEEEIHTYILGIDSMQLLLTYMKEHDLSFYLREIVVSYLNRLDKSPGCRVTFYASY